ncbi:DUF4936 family protein [Paucibacter sp. KBW04]|uniref:DUF4936 family protein n=1 Tax=Paucibacter sp. KBW04 TaxID=2153361 RepID=UPI0018CC5A96
MAEIYVYYKLASAQRQAALSAFGAACEALSEPRPRLLLRQDEARVDGLETWMEIHTGPQALQTEAALASALAPFAEGQRHREIFLPLNSLTGS